MKQSSSDPRSCTCPSDNAFTRAEDRFYAELRIAVTTYVQAVSECAFVLLGSMDSKNISFNINEMVHGRVQSAYQEAMAVLGEQSGKDH